MTFCVISKFAPIGRVHSKKYKSNHLCEPEDVRPKYFTNINRIRIKIYMGMLVEYQKLVLKNEATKNRKKNTKNLTM